MTSPTATIETAADLKMAQWSAIERNEPTERIKPGQERDFSKYPVVHTSDPDFKGFPPFTYAPSSKYEFQHTTNTHILFNMPRTKYWFVMGGSSASKTVSITIFLIDLLQGPKPHGRPWKHWTICEVKEDATDGPVDIFKSVMKDRGYWDPKAWRETDKTYTFPDGSIMAFRAPPREARSHGKHIDSVFINEANYIKERIYRQFSMRAKRLCILDWNPSSRFWYHKLRPNLKDASEVWLNSYGNEAVAENIAKGLENLFDEDPRDYDVYCLGNPGHLDERIYKGWIALKDIPPEFQLIARGIDYGLVDETAVLDFYKVPGSPHILPRTRLYQSGYDTNMLVDFLARMPNPTLPIVVPEKSINENQILEKAGFRLMDAPMNPGAVEAGIKQVRGHTVFYLDRDQDLIAEYEAYEFERDKFGAKTNKPKNHQDDHIMDTVRYLTMALGERVKHIKTDPDEKPKPDYLSDVQQMAYHAAGYQPDAVAQATKPATQHFKPEPKQIEHRAKRHIPRVYPH